ncbi:unnamed protein product, partial [Mesorhabditis spiculigera]
MRDVTANGGPVKKVLIDIQRVVQQRHANVFSNHHLLTFQVLLALSAVGRVLSLSSTLFAFLSLTSIGFYSLQLVKHFAVVQVITYAVVSLLSLFAYIFFGHIGLLYSEPMAGLLPVDMAMMVLLKQFLPDSIVLTTPFGRLKYTHLPLTMASLLTVAAVIRLVHPIAALQSFVAMQISWTYLRFIQPHSLDATIGDPSEHFSWASLFPSATRPAMAIIGKLFHRTLVRLGLFRRKIRIVDVSKVGGNNENLPSFEDPERDVERRKRLALQALKEGLSRRDGPESPPPTAIDVDVMTE